MVAVELEIMETRNISRGLLRIDVVILVVLYFLMSLIKFFRERYSEVILSLVFFETIINLIERKVDVAIRVGTLTDFSLRVRSLFNSYRKIIVFFDYIFRYGKLETIDDLK